jgi:hypothetical protein
MSHSPLLRRLSVALATAGLLALTLAAFGGATAEPALAQAGPNGAPMSPARTFSVRHGAVVTQLATAGSTGHQLGDLRVLPATPITRESGMVVGRLDAQLVTTSIDDPTLGDEVRMSTLNFVFGEGTGHLSGSADQLLVSGSGYYPSSLSTIPVGNALIRPIVGGSGIYAGATGWAKTEHFLDNTWQHTFYVLPTLQR